MSDTAAILRQAYDQFMLPLGGKRIPTPYRRNEFGSYQKLGPEFQGKSSPEVLTKTTEKLAEAENFDLDKTSVEEIRRFMVNHKLGIDCSGFVYRLLDHLTKKIGLGNLQEAAGMEHIGRTGAAKLTSDRFVVPVPGPALTRPGDILKFNVLSDIPHVAVILAHENGVITYAHSSSTQANGVHMGQIDNGKLQEKFQVGLGNPPFKIYRLKIFTEI